MENASNPGNMVLQGKRTAVFLVMNIINHAQLYGAA